MSQVAIEASRLSCDFASQTNSLFEDISLILTDSTYFLIGRNGSGKSTLAAMLAQPSVEVKHFCRVGYLPQGLDAFDGTVAQKLEVDQQLLALKNIEQGSVDNHDFTLAENNWDLPVVLEKQLTAYGLPSDILAMPYSSLSGGERTRLSLLALHRQGNDFNILDEPSNHLDAKGRQWLLSWVKLHPACLIISHDTLLLHQSKVILELSGHGLKTYRGGWEDYLSSKKVMEVSAERQVAQTEKDLKETKRSKQKSLEKLNAKSAQGSNKRVSSNQSKIILDKQKEKSEATGARLATIAQQQLSSASQMHSEAKEALEIIKPQAFIVGPVEEGKKKSLIVEQLCLPYCQQGPISFNLPFGDHLWLRGDNGVGKSTLFKILLGSVKPISGSIISTTSIAMLDQHFSFLDENSSAADNFERLSPGLPKDQYRTLLAQIRLRREAALQPVKSLSGGERLKLALSCIFSGGKSPALLLLDEPDNHLDLESKALLIGALKQYQGSMIIISHDAEFVDGIGIQNQLTLN